MRRRRGIAESCSIVERTHRRRGSPKPGSIGLDIGLQYSVINVHGLSSVSTARTRRENALDRDPAEAVPGRSRGTARRGRPRVVAGAGGLLGNPAQGGAAGVFSAAGATEVSVIADAEVARVKRDADLVALVRARGVELRRKGRSWQGRCPFHEDGKTPSLSISPDKGLWKCFGCGAGGDAIRFVELHDKVGFRDAVEALGGSTNGQAAVLLIRFTPPHTTACRWSARGGFPGRAASGRRPSACGAG